MGHESPLLQAVLQSPEDLAPRLSYAEELEQRGDPRGEFIAVQCELAQMGYEPWGKGWNRSRYAELEQRQRELLAAHEAEWARPLQGLARAWTFVAGFVEHVALEAEKFLARAEQLYRLAPVRHLDLLGAAAHAEPLAKSPHLERIASLDLQKSRLGDARLATLCGSPHLRRLAWLDLRDNELTLAGVEALATSRNLPRLVYVDLALNQFEDPREKASLDFDGSVASAEFPRQGAELERRFGALPWLHVREQGGRRFPPPRRFEV